MVETLAAPELKSWEDLRRAGAHHDALLVLRDVLRRGELPPHRATVAGQYLCKRFAAAESPPITSTVRLLGQCTTSFLVPALTAEAWGRGAAIRVTDGEYDNVIQELAAHEARPDVIVLLPWHQRLLADDDRTATQRVHDELAFMEQAQHMVLERGARLVQVGYDWLGPGPLGYQLAARLSGAVQLVREVNSALREQLPAGAYFVDLEQIAGAVGRNTFYDPRNYRWTKQPFSVVGLARLAQHLWAGIRALTTGPKKVLVLDLDNTLWGGIVGEVGALGVQLGDSPDGEAFRAFQAHVRQLGRRGIVLAVCSKNNARDAREPFEQNPDMVLKLGDFAAFEASWDPKPVALQRIAQTLRLGLDSFVFFDDSPVEREQVRQALPSVEVVNVPPDPADYVRALEEGLWFESATLTDADRERSAQYRAEQQRRELQAGTTNVADFLVSLDMQADVRPIAQADMQRVVQLLAKTNQFNLTTRRHTAEDVLRMLAQDGALGLTLRLTDRFGDYGLISVILAVPWPAPQHRGPKTQPELARTLRLDTWLMSCRAIGRTVEEYFLNVLVAAAAEKGYEQLLGEFIPTAKNSLVADMYRRFGFAAQPAAPDGVQRFVLKLSRHRPLVTYVTARE